MSALHGLLERFSLKRFRLPHTFILRPSTVHLGPSIFSPTAIFADRSSHGESGNLRGLVGARRQPDQIPVCLFLENMVLNTHRFSFNSDEYLIHFSENYYNQIMKLSKYMVYPFHNEFFHNGGTQTYVNVHGEASQRGQSGSN